MAISPIQRLAACPCRAGPQGAFHKPPYPTGRHVTLHLTQFEGGNALSSFRAQQLLTDLVSIHPKITGIAARFVHLVATDAAPTPALQERLKALLRQSSGTLLYS